MKKPPRYLSDERMAKALKAMTLAERVRVMVLVAKKVAGKK